MNRLKNSIAFLLCLLGFSSVQAQENTLLWSVSGNGLTETSYIYGTIHMMCGDDFEIMEKVQKAFDSCDQVFLELDMDDQKEMKKMMESVNGEKKLSEILTVEQQKRLDEKLQAELGMPLAAVDNYSLNTISSLFMVQGLDCKNIKSFEQEFVTMAQKSEKEVFGLEKVAYQLKCLDNSSDVETTFEALFDEESDGMLDSLITMYKAEDMKALNEMFSDPEYMDDNMREWLLVNRNENWVKRMPKIMKKKPTFFAVGSAHLLNDYGILALLKDKGYTVTPVFE